MGELHPIMQDPQETDGGEWCDTCQKFHRCETCNRAHPHPKHKATARKTRMQVDARPTLGR